MGIEKISHNVKELWGQGWGMVTYLMTFMRTLVDHNPKIILQPGNLNPKNMERIH